MGSSKKQNGMSPPGTAHFYRNADLHELRIALWQDGSTAGQALAAYLREAGASILVQETLSSASVLVPLTTLRAPPLHGAPSDAGPDIGPDDADAGSAGLRIDAAILSVTDPAALADSLEAAGIPVVTFTEETQTLQISHPNASHVALTEGLEAVASAVLVQSALRKSGLEHWQGKKLADILPRLRAMARFLVLNRSRADDLVAEAMEEAVILQPHLDAKSDTGALLVLLVERIWSRQKLSRPN